MANATIGIDTGFGVRVIDPSFRVYRAVFPKKVGDMITYTNFGDSKFFELVLTATEVSHKSERAYGVGILTAEILDKGETSRIIIPVRCELNLI